MRENSIIKKNILQFLEFKGISKYEFYHKTGVSNGVLTQKSGMSEENIHRFLSYYKEVNPTWLLTGMGSMINEDKTIVKEPLVLYNKKENNFFSKSQGIPLYNIEASAGIVTLFKDSDNYDPVDYINIPNLPKSDGALYVTGDSMYPLLKSGDIVIYKQLTTSIENIFWGEMYLISVELDDDVTTFVKWIQKSTLGDQYITLVSQNQHHQPKDIHISKIKALAMVKASIRINSMN
ncbi:S24 family peptidase [Empedobacter brevis]